MITDILNNQIQEQGIEFKYFITINSPYKQTNINRVIKRNKEIRRSIRGFYGAPIRFFFFTERHDTPGLPHHGGFHSHFLMEDCHPERWKTPSKRVERFLGEKDPEALYRALSGDEPSEDSKVALLKRALRLVPGVPFGWNGVSVEVIQDLQKVLNYCVKQVGKQLPASDVIDESNSDMDLNLYWKNWDDLSKKKHRHQVALA